jgi:hypothetical protein
MNLHLSLSTLSSILFFTFTTPVNYCLCYLLLKNPSTNIERSYLLAGFTTFTFAQFTVAVQLWPQRHHEPGPGHIALAAVSNSTRSAFTKFLSSSLLGEEPQCPSSFGQHTMSKQKM